MLFTFLFSTSTVPFLPYLGLFLVTFIEGPIATLAGGAFASSGVMQPLPVFLAIVLANLTADMGWYSLGRCGKVGWLSKIACKLGIDPCKVDQLSEGIQANAPRLLFMSKFTTGFPIPTLIATGLNKVPLRRWIAPLVSGELIKSALLISVGYFFSRTLDSTEGTLHTLLWVFTGVLLLAGFVWFKFFSKKRKPIQN
jgi:membrane protein DedA with SNARE-associated domain